MFFVRMQIAHRRRLLWHIPTMPARSSPNRKRTRPKSVARSDGRWIMRGVTDLGNEAVKLAPRIHKFAKWLGSKWSSLLA